MNHEESLKCLSLSKEKYSQGDFEGALRMAVKANRMFESAETSDWLGKVRVKANENESEGGVKENKLAREDGENDDNSTPNESTKLRHRASAQESTKSTSETLYTPQQAKDVQDFMKRNKNDYYAILSVSKSASNEEIKKAYKKLALKFHPDKNQAPGADEAFKVIAVAFSVLGDEDKRRNFDRFGAPAAGANSNGSNGFSAPGASFNFRGAEDISPEDLFNMFFEAAFSNQHSTGAHPFTQHFGGNPFGGGVNFQFGGPGQFFYSSNNFHRPQRTQRRQQQPDQNDDLFRKLSQYIPLILVFVISIISSILFPSDSSSSKFNQKTDHLFSLNPTSTNRFSRFTKLKHVPYYASSTFQQYFDKLKDGDTSSKLFRELTSYENVIETTLLKELRQACVREERQLADKLKKAKKDQIDEIKKTFKLNSCDTLKQFT